MEFPVLEVQKKIVMNNVQISAAPTVNDCPFGDHLAQTTSTYDTLAFCSFVSLKGLFTFSTEMAYHVIWLSAFYDECQMEF